ncbi:MerR family transcriptional regulator [Nucisporomicrobium flavum]|uniref:MerR family transcriptional regulator n=1 Tax=Nucisporomicrobium flavum TaxID=2785915 RepID=UPI0018F3B282|nr:MerR family transcriptional regulator [Nucisporomicrobium flavum]
MRIKELAELTGCTVRTIRFYHQIGLLNVPERRDGARDYDLTHLARLARVRWLAEAGIPLATVATMIGGRAGPGRRAEAADADEVLTDLRAGIAALDEKLEELREQRDRMARLAAVVEHDGRLSLVPPAVARFYEDMEARAGDEKARRVIRRERDFMELAYYRGDIPAESTVLYEGLTEAGLARSLESFRTIAHRYEGDEPLGDREIERAAAEVVERVTRQLGADFPRVARTLDLDVARRAADLYLRLSAPRHRRLDRAIADALLTAFEKGRTE